MAARRRLRAANSTVAVDAVVARLEEDSADDLLRGANLVLDGLDTMATREVVNRACIGLGVPWIYAGVEDTVFSVATFAGGGPCLSCLWPPSARAETQDFEQGVLNTAPAAAAALQVSEAFRLLCGGEMRPLLSRHNLWSGTSHTVEIVRDPECLICGGG